MTPVGRCTYDWVVNLLQGPKMMPDLAPNLSSPVDEGRTTRAKVLIGIAVVVFVVVAAFGFWQRRESADRLVELEADLEESFSGMKSSDLSPDDFSDSGWTDRLISNGGADPNLVSLDGDVILARYGYDFIGSRDCVRVSWTPDDVTFERGEGAQCTTPILN